MRHQMRQAALALAVLLLCGVSGTVQAGPITVDSGWQSFNWVGNVPAFNLEGAFTFTASGPVTLTVTDAFVDGDRFVVLDSGLFVGATSKPADDGAWIGSPDAALLSPKWSHGVFTLGVGFHSLTFVAIDEASGYTSGGAYFKVESTGRTSGQAPEPGTLTLAVLGAAGFGWRRWGRGRPNAAQLDGIV